MTLRREMPLKSVLFGGLESSVVNDDIYSLKTPHYFNMTDFRRGKVRNAPKPTFKLEGEPAVDVPIKPLAPVRL